MSCTPEEATQHHNWPTSIKLISQKNTMHKVIGSLICYSATSTIEISTIRLSNGPEYNTSTTEAALQQRISVLK